MLTGPDVSNHQGAVSFAHVASRGQFIIAKATESTTYADPWFGVNKTGARNAGLLFGAYHFARGGNPNAEAAYFLAHADHQPGELLILDWEISHPTPDAWCAVFCSRLAAAGVIPVMYMNSSSARSSSWAATRATGAVLWVAQYGANKGTPGAPPSVGAWGNYAMWQYTSLGAFPGVPTRADVSLFYGDAARWRALGGIQTASAVTFHLPTVSATAPGPLTTTAPAPAQEDDDMATIIFNGTYGSALLDGGRLIGLGDQASVDAFQAAGLKRVAVTDVDFLRLRTQTAPGLLLYNAPENGGRGWAYLSGGKTIGVGEQSTVDALKSQGCPVLSLDAAEFARFAG